VTFRYLRTRDQRYAPRHCNLSVVTVFRRAIGPFTIICNKNSFAVGVVAGDAVGNGDRRQFADILSIDRNPS
jgi:hypothetical protein